MDLMTASTSYAKLQMKDRNFGAPTVRIHVDGVEITEKKGAKLSGVTVDLTAESSASGCSFDVVGEYEPKNTAFSAKGAAELLQLGAKVELELGYIETVPVFYGLIAEIEYNFDNEDAPYIHVECMDAKCLLMKRQRLALFSEKSVTDAIGEMMDGQPFSDYITGKQVEAYSEKLDMLPAAMEDDFQFTTRYAQYIGYEFFIVQGKVYFRKAPTSYSSIMTISPKLGLLSAKQSLRGVALHKKALVVGINPADDKMVSGEAVISGKFGGGSSAKRMMGESEKIHFDHHVVSAEQAQARAKTLLQAARGSFGRLDCKCVGIPELVPGRSVTIDGVSPDADKEYYILGVRHTMDERGFFTNLEARIDTL
jgi:phage protein D